MSYDERGPGQPSRSWWRTPTPPWCPGGAAKFAFLRSTATRLVVDLYDPLVLENLHYYLGKDMGDRDQLNRHVVEITNEGVRLGDFFLCGSERQRDFWLGVLAANGRVNPRTYRDDESLRRLVDVVGIGLPSRPPQPGPGLKGRHPRIPSDARVVLWNGGIWNWLDLIYPRPSAWPRVVVARAPGPPRLPRHAAPESRRCPATRWRPAWKRRAAGLGERERDGRLPRVGRPETHGRRFSSKRTSACRSTPFHVETRYSVRTRVIDCFWAKLPVVVYGRRRGGGLGLAPATTWDAWSPPGDAEAVARALVEVLELAPRLRAGSTATPPLYEALRWERLVEPLRALLPRRRARRPRSPAGGSAWAASPNPLRPPPGLLLRAGRGCCAGRVPLAFRARRGSPPFRFRPSAPRETAAIRNVTQGYFPGIGVVRRVLVQRLVRGTVAPVRRRGHGLHHELLLRRGLQPPGSAPHASGAWRSGTASASAASPFAPGSSGTSRAAAELRLPATRLRRARSTCGLSTRDRSCRGSGAPIRAQAARAWWPRRPSLSSTWATALRAAEASGAPPCVFGPGGLHPDDDWGFRPLRGSTLAMQRCVALRGLHTDFEAAFRPRAGGWTRGEGPRDPAGRWTLNGSAGRRARGSPPSAWAPPAGAPCRGRRRPAGAAQGRRHAPGGRCRSSGAPRPRGPPG